MEDWTAKFSEPDPRYTVVPMPPEGGIQEDMQVAGGGFLMYGRQPPLILRGGGRTAPQQFPEGALKQPVIKGAQAAPKNMGPRPAPPGGTGHGKTWFDRYMDTYYRWLFRNEPHGEFDMRPPRVPYSDYVA